MNENFQIWLDTLKTGQYQQATGALDVVDDGGNHSFCCLGVACDLAVKDGVEMEIHTSDDNDVVSYDREQGVLPGKVKDWLGLDQTNPRIVVQNPNFVSGDDRCAHVYSADGERSQLANPRYLINEYVTELNDEYGLTFEQIAQLVEFAGGFSEEV